MIDASFARHWFMHTPHTAVGVGVTAKASFLQPPLPVVLQRQPAPKREDRALRVGLVTGPEATWDVAADRLAEHLFRGQSLEVGHAWDCVDLGIEDPTDYDCLVLLGWPEASQRRLIKRIELYCRGGGSLVALRAMHAEIPGWPSFAEEVLGGRQPPASKCRLWELHRSDCAWHHPVVQGVETLIAEGEVYSGPRFAPGTTVLLNNLDAGQHGRQALPAAWARRHEGGRVFCTTLGLDDDFREPSFLRLISNAVHWTAQNRRW